MFNKKINYKLNSTSIIVIPLIICLCLWLSGCNINKEISSNIYFSNNTITKEQKDELSRSANISSSSNYYENAQQFSNFRALKGGRIKNNYFFRGASPYLDEERTEYVNHFLEFYKIKNVISLSESKKQIDEYIKSPNISEFYFSQKYNNDELNDTALDYEAVDLNKSEDVKKIIKSFYEIISSEGNVYIHCAIGRDRTGVYCELVEALADFSYDEIVDDYMKSFENYSYITKDENPQIYENVKNSGVDNTLSIITKTKDKSKLKELDLKESAINLLLNNGMNKDDLEKFINKITQ